MGFLTGLRLGVVDVDATTLFFTSGQIRSYSCLFVDYAGIVWDLVAMQ